MTRKTQRKPFKTLASDLKALRKRPLSKEKVEEFNKIMERDERESGKPAEQPARKIAAREPSL